MLIILTLIYLRVSVAQILPTNGAERFKDIGLEVKDVLKDFESFASSIVKQIIEAQTSSALEGTNHQQQPEIKHSASQEEVPTTTEEVLTTSDDSEIQNVENPSLLENSMVRRKRDTRGTHRFEKLRQNTETCSHKTQKDLLSEKQQLDGIKKEVFKLNEIVKILRDQQNFINTLNQEIENNSSKHLDSSNILKRLKELKKNINTSDIENQEFNDINRINFHVSNVSTHEQLEQIKTELSATVSMLNKTEFMFFKEMEREDMLAVELNKQKNEIMTLKTLVKDMFEKGISDKKNTNTKLNTTTDIDDEMVEIKTPYEPKRQEKIKSNTEYEGENVHATTDATPWTITLETTPEKVRQSGKDVGKLIRLLSGSSMNKKYVSSNIRDQVRETSETTLGKTKESDDKELEKLLRLLSRSGKNKKDDSSSVAAQIRELSRELDNEEKKEKEDRKILVQMELLQRLINQQQEDPTPNPLANRFSEIIMHNLNIKKPAAESKSDSNEDDINNELKQLQIAINNLRTKEDTKAFENFKQVPNEQQQFQDMLEKLLSENRQQSGTRGGGFSNTESVNQLTSEQILQILNQADGKHKSGYRLPNVNYGNPAYLRGLVDYAGGSPQYSKAPQESSYFSRIVPNYPTSYYNHHTPTEQPSAQNLPNSYFNSPNYLSSNVWYNPALPSPTKSYSSPAYGNTDQQSNPVATNFVSTNYGNSPDANQLFRGLSNIQPNTQFIQSNSGHYPKAVAGSNLEQSTYDTPKTGTITDGYKYNIVDDLRGQIENLENIINNLSTSPDYSQQPEDKATVANLEQKIGHLKGVVESLYNDPINDSPTVDYSPKSINYEKNKHVDVLVPQQPPLQSTQPLPPNYHSPKLRSKRQEEGSESQLLQQLTNVVSKILDKGEENTINNKNRNSEAYEHIQSQLDMIKKQLGPLQHGRYFDNLKYQNNQPHLLNQYDNNFTSDKSEADLIKSKNSEKQRSIKDDIFTKIVLKIVDKVVAATPAVLERLFGHGIDEIGNSYGDSYNELQNMFKNLGYFGYLPLILVKAIDAVATLFKILQKNQVFRSFLLPAFVLAIVAGSVFFLIWFYQQDGYYDNATNHNNYNHDSYKQENNGNSYYSRQTRTNGQIRASNNLYINRNSDFSGFRNNYIAPLHYNDYESNTSYYTQGYPTYFRAINER